MFKKISLNSLFKKFSTKSKKIMGISILTSVSFFWLLSLILTIPGMGIQSLQFISSVEKQITKIMPKNKFVVDPNYSLYETVMDSAIRSSYIADAVSTINHNDAEDMAQHRKVYEDFANNWFNNKWGEKIKNKEQIDLYDVGLDVIEFDQEIAKLYHSYGFVNTGIQWMFHKNGMKEIFSDSVSTMALNNQTIIDQEIYNKTVKSEIGMTGLSVSYSPGTMILNNKVWFLNQQIESLKFILNLPIKPFMDKTLTKDTLNNLEVTVDDLFVPNFLAGMHLAQAGSIMFIIALIIVIPGLIIGTVAILEYKKEK
ncbi:hypothetical protein [Spiroplasma taiwanense]|uniref:Transmembrane protein n=1 Tax=Spiroplasma taiwanense CT-1 TaxID=1276220 RepID=S5LZR4_9MOLU|nr:hypothetical protein [Spiroplasma taiwanense]AGR41182.1 hypothetical protein STAIW_v1c05600 [Spiroplasma taiwanense CT-1]